MTESRESFNLRVSAELARLRLDDPVGYSTVRWPRQAGNATDPNRVVEVVASLERTAPEWLLSQLWQEEFGHDP
jgi:hypothetical protein